jgi:hypothetical protein
MIEEENIDENPSPYLKIQVFTNTIDQFREDYAHRMRLLNTTFERIHDILDENNINPRILDNMKFKNVSETQLEFVITEKRNNFYVYVTLHSTKKEPFLTFGLKNEITGSVLEEILHVYRFESTLSTKFLFLFKNNFKSYYKS